MESEGSLPGAITAYSAKTGDMAWRFNTIPRPGEPASETWEDPTSWEITGGANNWTGMALDKERELLFVPTGSATPDFYGATRPGDNLYANFYWRSKPARGSSAGTTSSSAMTCRIRTSRLLPRSSSSSATARSSTPSPKPPRPTGYSYSTVKPASLCTRFSKTRHSRAPSPARSHRRHSHDPRWPLRARSSRSPDAARRRPSLSKTSSKTSTCGLTRRRA